MLNRIKTTNYDPNILDDVKKYINTPWLENPIWMPDVHKGKGIPIGTTGIIHDEITPAAVSADIGCGVLTVKLQTKDKIDLELLDKIIRNKIPAGSTIHKEEQDYTFNLEWKDQIPDKDFSKVKRSLGTLGGGNHFIELSLDSKNNYWLTVHTGSRMIGNITNYYYTMLANGYKPFKENPESLDINKTLNGENFRNYVDDVKTIQDFAKANRKKIIETIVKTLSETNPTTIIDQIESAHNYLDFKGNTAILRKGAISAKLDELLIIPINMRDGSLICKGLGNKDWNYSAPHGAGRRLSRTQAKEDINIETFKKQMQGIYTTCINKATIAEAPDAYKDIKNIKEDIQETAKIIEHLKVIYNYKHK